jgi:predicted dehydrogenase
MNESRSTRREFLKRTSAASALTFAPYWWTSRQALAQQPPSDRLRIGGIGIGGRGLGVMRGARQFADVVAVCDVDRQHAERGQKDLSDGKADIYEDYRAVLDRPDVDVVGIFTPDHWHTKIAIEAMQAGKDVYCEKPLTLTIEEGQQICEVAKKTERVFQVGTQQRTEMGQRFLQAIALVRDGRIGKVQRVQCAIGANPTSEPLETKTPPDQLNWEMWLGQAPQVDYIPKRCHNEFRWWYEYSGGKLTDWGAHHVDIAQWAIGRTDTGPSRVEVVNVEHPVPMAGGYPTVDNQYNVASEFMVRCHFPDDVEMTIRHDTDNGILFEGTEGRFFVNRSRITGKPVEDLVDHPLPEGAIAEVYNGTEPTSHMANFFDCVRSRALPISDVFSHHRALTTCHLTNIALRLGRTIEWDPLAETIVGDPQAQEFTRREQRAGYEIKV